MAVPQEQLDRLQPERSGDRSREASESLQRDVNETIRASGARPGAADYHNATEQLQRSGILPNVMIGQFGNLDRDRSGTLTETEVRQAINDRNTPFLAGVAARGLRGTLREMGGTVDPSTGEYSVTRNQYEAFLRRRQQPEARPGETPAPLEATAPGQQPRPGASRLPEAAPQTPEAQRQIDILQSGRGTPQERLAAVTELARQGVTRVTLMDSNGRAVECRIQVEAVARGSNRNYVHLFARGENGREQILLRGIGQDGNYTQQQQANRQAADYTGTNWNRARPNSVLSGRPS
ncbi:MAG: hypothetical protein IAF58_15355 [Leptolyngbya sp.]|nr:hypothetical protein [Candidatus Melainabacteria bacterium]